MKTKPMNSDIKENKYGYPTKTCCSIVPYGDGEKQVTTMRWPMGEGFSILVDDKKCIELSYDQWDAVLESVCEILGVKPPY